MKIQFYFWKFFIAGLFFSPVLMAQTAGDYRSNVALGDWSAVGTWQIFDGTSWVAASATPTGSDGVITIVSGDSIRMTAPVSPAVDQVQVASGGILVITGNNTFPINDGPGDDVTVDGKLYIGSLPTIVSGTGTMLVNNDGMLIIRNSASLGISTTNNGQTTFSGNAFIINSTFTNNNSFIWTTNDIALNNATFINNGTFDVQISADANFNGNLGGSVFTNSASGVILKDNAAGICNILQNVNFTNSGTIEGIGQFVFSSTTLVNTGNISPGNPTGLLSVNPSFVTGKSPTFNIEINSTGAVAGTNYDQASFSNVGAVNVTNSVLNVTDNASDPIGTVYIILISPSGTITGTFSPANIHLSSTLGNLMYNSQFITVQKISTLPVIWGSFVAIAKANTVELDWSTLQEENTSHFVVEYSADGAHFNAIGAVAAKGFSSIVSNYSFTHANPLLNATNYYRLQQVDLDGKTTSSVIRAVHFNDGKAIAVQITPNPVHSSMLINIQADDITVVLHDFSGRTIHSWRLDRGQHQTSVQDLPAGIYQLTIYQKQQFIASQQIIKY